MGESHRLRPLQVGVTRQYRALMHARRRHQRLLQLMDGAEQQLPLRLAPEFQIGGHLIVARTAGVQLLAQIADPLDELAFDPGVDIFGIGLQDLIRIGLYLGQQGIERHFQSSLLLGAQHADLHQGPGPTDRAGDVLLGQAIVKPQGIIELLEPGIGCLTETSAPQRHGVLSKS